MINNYKLYIDALDAKFANYFEAQKDYIFCKEGCALCCRDSEYPYTRLEHEYLMQGFEQLQLAVQNIVSKNIQKTKEARAKHSSQSTFEDNCPFLVNDKCCVYEYRGIVCRRFGLAYTGEDGRIKLPYCVYQGLNYSNVYDVETKMLSPKMFAATGFEKEPVAYNLNLKFLLNNEATQSVGLEFGEVKALIDWF